MHEGEFLHTSDVHYRGITAYSQLHYRGNPSKGYFIPAVLPRDSRENPRYYRGYRGITAVPITVQLPTRNYVWDKLLHNDDRRRKSVLMKASDVEPKRR